ncbi:MAG: hypothetical protein K0B05_08050 [Bacteroidales bacterium]|nr:hypothetical protein [Bacteroidales bacterium]
MKRFIIPALILLLVALTLASCASSRKNRSELRGLMLMDNKHLPRNKPYYSSHNKKLKREASRKYRSNNRDLYRSRR